MKILISTDSLYWGVLMRNTKGNSLGKDAFNINGNFTMTLNY